MTVDAVEAHEAHEAQRVALRRVIALVNDKGGVGKTTITSNLAGQLAGAGYRVLAVDLNRQANMSDDLGYRGLAGVDDQGAGLLTALMMGTPVVPVEGVRPNLWVVPGGVTLNDLTPLLVSRFQTNGRQAFRVLARSLVPVADRFDVILIDSPPENLTLSDLALGTARWVIMPTKSDRGGLVGMRLVAGRFVLAREINPGLGLLGVVLFASGTSAHAIHRKVRAEVTAAFGGVSPMLSSTIRASEALAQVARDTGRLVHELELDAAAQPAWWKALRAGTNPGRRIPPTVSSLSADFRALASEVLDTLATQETAEQGGEPGDQ